MRLLADENFPKSTVEMLRAEANDVLWARTWAGQIGILGTDGIQMPASRKRLEQ